MGLKSDSKVVVAALLGLGLIGLLPSPAAAAGPDATGTLTGASGPAGLAFGPDGTAYVADFGTGLGTNVRVYPPGSTTPTRTLSAGIGTINVAVQPGTGDVFVASALAELTGRIYVFDPGAATPNPAKTRTGTTQPAGLAFAPNGDLYATSYNTNKVQIYGAGSLTPTSSLDTALAPSGLAFQPGTNDLYVAAKSSHIVQVFEPGASTPNLTKQLSLGTGEPGGIAFHPASRIAYVSVGNTNEVLGYPAGSTAASAPDTLTGSVLPLGVAVNPVDGRIYVASHDTAQVLPYAAPVPTVTSVTPNHGLVTGGQTVVVNGSNLGAVSQVTFGGTAGTSVTPLSASQVQVVTPARATAGAVDVNARWLNALAGAAAAYTYDPTVPNPPTDVTGAWGNNQVTVSWTPPAFTGGQPITSYTVTASPGGLTCATTATSCVLSGLVNGTPYTFTVTATNATGTSAASTPSAAVTPAKPLAVKVSKPLKATKKLPHKGSKRLVKSAKSTKKGRVEVTASCSQVGSALPSSAFCSFKITSKAKVTVKTKGISGVIVTVTIKSVPKTPNPALGSSTWSRSWTTK